MAVNYKSEDFGEPFDSANFIERISANVLGGGTKGGQEGFDPLKLRDHFLETIKNLQTQSELTTAQISKLEKICSEHEQKHKEKASDVEKQYKNAMSTFHDLDDRINSVATKVVHLGDQLENISIPRQRAQETQHAMKYFDEFHSGKELSPLFNDKAKLHEAAAVIHQLLLVADELPKEKFERVQRKIQEKYSTIESDLMREFVNAYKIKDIDKMARSAKTLLPFKNYHLCYEELIKMAVEELFTSEDIFEDILQACNKVQDISTKVFEHNAEHVLSKFVQYVFEKKLAGYIYKQLPNKMEEETYLKKLSYLYGRTKEINKKLCKLRLGSDSAFLERITKPLFSNYLKRYIEDELQYLEEESISTLNRFYNSIGHVKKEIRQNFIAEIPDSLKELHKKIPGRDKSMLKENLLSQDVALTLLQENKLSIRRAEMDECGSDYLEIVELATMVLHGDEQYRLRKPGPVHHARFMVKEIYFLKMYLLPDNISSLTDFEKKLINDMAFFTAVFYTEWFIKAEIPAVAPYQLSPLSELPNNVFRIFKLFLKYLGEEHFEYAVDVHLQYLPPIEAKTPPDIMFLTVLYQSNTIFHLIEKHFTDFIVRTVGSSTIYGECALKKKQLVDNLESKLNSGMERVLSSMVNYMKFLLNSEQKKSDFRPDGEDGAMTQTSACISCCRYIKILVPSLYDALDGKNLEVVLIELGTRFHKVLMEHFFQFTYTDIGAMVALCDVNEYRHAIKLFKIPLLDRLFNVLSALVNLLVVQPDNLKDVGSEEQLVDIDKNVLQQFIQLRADFKSLKIGKVFS